MVKVFYSATKRRYEKLINLEKPATLLHFPNTCRNIGTVWRLLQVQSGSRWLQFSQFGKP